MWRGYMHVKTFKINVAYPKALVASIVCALLITLALILIQPYTPAPPQNPFPYLSIKWWRWWMFPTATI